MLNFNNLSVEEIKQALFTCCGSMPWVGSVMSDYPFVSEAALLARAETAWYEGCGEEDWLEAFNHHPKIGDIKSLESKFAATKHLAGNEQYGIVSATKDTIEQLAQANQDYEKKFGFIFIVCATGKSAQEMLRLLQDRLGNSKEDEIAIAMGEQHKITILRLKKMLPYSNWTFLKNSQITTHVLDTSVGKVGQDISIRLKKQLPNGVFQTITQGITNNDGRIGDLLPPLRVLPAGVYMMSFDTAAYFKRQNLQGFYPSVDIQFYVSDDTHYHIPLLINPYGYSTYRGS